MSLNFKAWCDSMTTIRTFYTDTEYLTVSKDANKFGVVPSSKALVIKKSLYDIVIFEE